MFAAYLFVYLFVVLYFLVLVLQDASGSSYIFAAPRIKAPGTCYWRILLKYKILEPSVLIAMMVCLL